MDYVGLLEGKCIVPKHVVQIGIRSDEPPTPTLNPQIFHIQTSCRLINS